MAPGGEVGGEVVDVGRWRYRMADPSCHPQFPYVPESRRNIARMEKRCPSKITSVVNMLKVVFTKKFTFELQNVSYKI